VIFVDSGAWYASACPEDENHRRAREWLAQNEEPLLTTDYVIDETLTLFRARGNSQRAIQIGTQFFAEELATVHFLTPDQISSAWGVFRDFADKKWSFSTPAGRLIAGQKLYLFYSLQTRDEFKSDPRRLSMQADAKWPDVAKVLSQ
jgi:predicted nucleic acid-binding protein